MTNLRKSQFPSSPKSAAGARAVIAPRSLSPSRPDLTPRPDGTTRRGSSPGHPIPPTAPWPGIRIRDASPLYPARRWRGAAALSSSNLWRSPSRLR